MVDGPLSPRSRVKITSTQVARQPRLALGSSAGFDLAGLPFDRDFSFWQSLSSGNWEKLEMKAIYTIANNC
jgi:hypothetical protein